MEMSKLEKVIKGLEQFKADFKPFCGNGSDWARVDDAIALLKEQEPLEPITEGNEHIHVFRCRKCNRILQRNNEMDYCPKCGQSIKWQ